VTKVLLADPDAPTRAGIRVALEAGGFEVCAEPADAGTALQAALRERPEVCLVDMNLPGGALDVVEAIADRLPTTKFVLLGDSGEERAVLAAVMAGASGYLDKDMAPKRLLATVRGVLDGEAGLSRRTTHLVLEAFRSRERGRRLPSSPGQQPLTPREFEALELLAKGMGTTEVAGALSISEVTVRRHVQSVVAKLGVADRKAAVAALLERSRS
jgi:DNA-binding NarL/FixJ family response regulator